MLNLTTGFPASALASAKKIRVLIPTTTGVVEVLRLAKEGRDLPRSTVRVNLDTTKAAGIDAAYNEFVNSPSGLIERHTGHNRFRVDVSGAIDGGNSWQMGLLLAHALHEAGRLAMRNEKGEGDLPDGVVWATGELRIDHRVVQVGEVPRKLALSAPAFTALRRDALPFLVFVPIENSTDPATAEALAAFGAGPQRQWSAVGNINEALAILGLAPLAAEAAPTALRWRGNPYRGLSAFDFEHRDVFFGRAAARERACATLINNADNERFSFLLVTGQSGSGKSSLARAGLAGDLAQARAGRWLQAVTVPRTGDGVAITALASTVNQALEAAGARPDDALANLLREEPDAAARLVVGALDDIGVREGYNAYLTLVVDQLEEILVGAGPSGGSASVGEAEHYGRALRALAESRRVWIIATLRSDLYHLIEAAPSLAALVRDTATFLLPRPQRQDIRDIIRRPAMAAGARFEIENPDNPANTYSLADQIELDALQLGDHPSLPLLEFALALLFERRTPQGVLTHKTYADMGRLGGAIARYADQAIDEAFKSADDRFDLEEALKWVLLRLVQVQRPDATDDTATRLPTVCRRIAVAGSGGAETANDRVLDILRRARLVDFETVKGATTARLAHDALIELWPRLKAVVSNYRDDLLLREELLAQHRRWVASERRAWVLQADALAEAQALQSRWAGHLDPDLTAFIATSERTAGDALTRWNRFRNAVAGTIAVAAVAAAIGWWQASRSAERARDNMLAAVEANVEVSDRVLEVLHGPGLRTGVAQTLLADAERRLSTLVDAEVNDAGLRLLQGDARAALLLALSTSLLNFSEIELEQTGPGEAFQDRLARVAKALDAAERLGATATDLRTSRARLMYTRGNAAVKPDDAVGHYRAALSLLDEAGDDDSLLRGRILQSRGLAQLGSETLEAPQAAVRDLEAALATFKRLSTGTDDRVHALRDVLAVQYRLAEAAIGTNDLASALGRTRQALDDFHALPGALQRHVALIYEQFRLLSLQAYLHRCTQAPAPARTEIRNALTHLDGLIGLDPDNSQWRYDRLVGLLEEAETIASAGDASGGAVLRASVSQQWDDLLRTYPSLQSNGPPEAGRCPR